MINWQKCSDDFVSKRRFTKRDRNLLNCSQFYWHTCVYGSLARIHLFRLVTKISLLARARDMPQWAIVMHDAMRCSTPEQTYKRDTDVKRRTPHTFIYELWKFFAFDHRFGFLHWFARLVCSGGWKQWFCNIAFGSISLCLLAIIYCLLCGKIWEIFEILQPWCKSLKSRCAELIPCELTEFWE